MTRTACCPHRDPAIADSERMLSWLNRAGPCHCRCHAVKPLRTRASGDWTCGQCAAENQSGRVECGGCQTRRT